jgi:hypothetical protein
MEMSLLHFPAFSAVEHMYVYAALLLSNYFVVAAEFSLCSAIGLVHSHGYTAKGVFRLFS